MHNVTLQTIGVQTSSLGMGCASLGSRVSATQGETALAQAWEAGVRWFDVAPAYGGGEAEALLGAFLASRGADHATAQICTKVGLAPPPQNSAKKLLRAALRPVSRSLTSVRALIRRSGATANHRQPLTTELLQSSLDRSLRRLKVEQVSLYALHNADPQDLQRDDILQTLENLITAGKTRAIAVAGDTEVAQKAASVGAPFAAVQLAHPVSDLTPLTAARTAGLDVITHSVFGVAGELAALERRLRQDKTLHEALQNAQIAPPDAPLRTVAAAALLARARASNPTGVVLCSMYSKHSLEQNIRAAQATPQPLPVLI